MFIFFIVTLSFCLYRKEAVEGLSVVCGNPYTKIQMFRLVENRIEKIHYLKRLSLYIMVE